MAAGKRSIPPSGYRERGCQMLATKFFSQIFLNQVIRRARRGACPLWGWSPWSRPRQPGVSAPAALTMLHAGAAARTCSKPLARGNPGWLACRGHHRRACIPHYVAACVHEPEKAVDSVESSGACPCRGGASIIRAGETVARLTPGAHAAVPILFQSPVTRVKPKKAAHRFSAIRMRSLRSSPSARLQPCKPSHP